MDLDTTAARERMLARIRSRQGRAERLRPIEQREAEAWLAGRARGPQPAFGRGVHDQFAEMASRMHTTLDVVASAAEVPAAVARYLQAQALPPQAAGHGTVARLDWAAAGIAFEARPPREADAVGITGCFCAVAETGSLVFASGPDTPASTHLLPETHVVVLDAARIVAYQEDAFELMRQELGEIPRGFNTVSGPSRTGDIEQTIVLGAHGPYRVHVVIVGGGA